MSQLIATLALIDVRRTWLQCSGVLAEIVIYFPCDKYWCEVWMDMTGLVEDEDQNIDAC